VLTNLKNLSAQTPLDIKVEEDFTGYMLSDFFMVMEQQYDLRFFYKKKWIENIIIQDITTEKSIRTILENTLNSFDLSHIDIQNSNIILIPENFNYFEKDQAYTFIQLIGNPLDKGKYTLNKVEGFVYFGKTGDPLPGALVQDKKSGKQVMSDYQGYYSLNLPGGSTQLQFSFMGLETNLVEVEILSPGKLNVELLESPIAIDAVTVTANGGKTNINQTQMGMVHMDIKNLSKLPVLMGEADIIKSLTLLPGVNTSGELSSGFNVRGGNVDQNLVLLNDAPIYNSAHLFGMFSAFIPNAISSVNLHKGTQPANFGSRVASTMEIKLKNPDTLKLSGKAGVGILNSSLFVEGPVINHKITFLLGARTTYSNWLLKKMPTYDIRNSTANFFDAIGKMDFKINSKNTLSFFGYGSHDTFSYSNKNDYSYGSFLTGINYNHFVSDHILLHTTFSYSKYFSTVGTLENEYTAYQINTGIEQYNSRFEWSYQAPKNSMLAGFEAIHYLINPGEQEKVSENSDALVFSLTPEKAIEGAIFFQDSYTLTANLSATAGLRYALYSKIGTAETYIYAANSPINDNTVQESIHFNNNELVKLYQGLEPRLGIKYRFNESSSVKAGYNMNRQFQHLITNTSATTPADYWKSADQNIKPIISQQYALGYFRNFLNNIIETSAEIYFKTSKNVLEYKNGAVLAMNKSIERDVIAGYARSYGLEFMLKKNLGNLTGWLSYTLSRSEIQTRSKFVEETINDGNYFPTYNDRLHDLSLAVNYQLSRRWTVGSNFLFSSGRPTTYPEQKYTYHNIEVIDYSTRNKYRLQAYHRLDMSITYEGFLNLTKRVHPSFTFSVYNVYGHKNTYSTYYKKDTPSAINNYQQYGLYKLSIIGIPIPSITLNLTF
jgi:hypothetical protein